MALTRDQQQDAEHGGREEQDQRVGCPAREPRSRDDRLEVDRYGNENQSSKDSPDADDRDGEVFPRFCFIGTHRGESCPAIAVLAARLSGPVLHSRMPSGEAARLPVASADRGDHSAMAGRRP